jgi:hypothetical protein
MDDVPRNCLRGVVDYHLAKQHPGIRTGITRGIDRVEAFLSDFLLVNVEKGPTCFGCFDVLGQRVLSRETRYHTSVAQEHVT